MKHYLIYKITNLINNKIYIGKHETSNLNDNYFGSGLVLKQAIKKYGKENFLFEVLIDLNNAEEMTLLEKCVVNEDFIKRSDVYNRRIGGDGGKIEMTPEIRRKISLSNMGHVPHSKGKHLSDETKQKISLATKGKKKISMEQRKKISESLRKHPEKHQYWKGKKMPREMVEKRLKKVRGSIRKNGTKVIYEGKEEYLSYLCKTLNLNKSSIFGHATRFKMTIQQSFEYFL